MGGVAGLAIIGAAVFFFLRRRTRKRQHHISYSSAGGATESGGGGGGIFGGAHGGRESKTDFYSATTAATAAAAAAANSGGLGGGTYSDYSGDSHRLSSMSGKARPFVAPLGGGPSDDDSSAGYYSPSQRPQQHLQPQYNNDYYDQDFYAAPYQYIPNHPMQYPYQNQSGSTQPSSGAPERHVPNLVQDTPSIDVPHSKDD